MKSLRPIKFNKKIIVLEQLKSKEKDFKFSNQIPKERIGSKKIKRQPGR